MIGSLLACVWAALGVAVFASPVLAADKDEIVVVQSVLRQQFDPTAVVATTDSLVHVQLFDGLLNLTEKGFEPALAESWVVSPDGKQIDFTLRKGVKFQNGDPFTADDVKFTFERIIAPDSTHSYRKPFQEALERVDVLAPDKARFVLKAPWPSFFTAGRNALVAIAPKAYYERVGAKGFQDKPVGTGPYKLAELKAGEWTKVIANPDYWGGAPEVKAVTTRLVKEPFTRFAMLTRGEADIISDISGPLFEKIKQNKNVRIFSAKRSGTSSMFFNKTTFPQSADIRVRMAIGYAIDLKGIADNVLGGVCEPAPSMLTPETFGYLPGVKVTPYDPAKAKSLLAEAGIKPGQAVTFVIHTESFASLPNATQTLEAIAGYLEAVGLKVERKQYETGAFFQMMRGGKQPDIFYGPISIPDDGATIMDGWYLPGSVWSAGNVDVPEYIDIYKKQLNELDTEKRRKLIQQFAAAEDKDRRAVPLFWCDTPFAVGPRIKDWKIGQGSGYHMNLHTVTFQR